MAVQGIGGLGFDGDELTIDPSLPDEWGELRFPVTWRGQRLRITVADASVRVDASDDNDRTVHLRVRGGDVELGPGDSRVVH